MINKFINQLTLNFFSNLNLRTIFKKTLFSKLDFGHIFLSLMTGLDEICAVGY